MSERDTTGPDAGFDSMCPRCGRGLVSVGEWCCGDWTPAATTLADDTPDATAERPSEVETLGDRFWSKVDKTSGCWTWTGSVRNHYGRYWLDGKQKTAHRLTYEAEFGPIADGLVVDHVCRNKLCVRPSHLRAVVPRVNVLAGPTHHCRSSGQGELRTRAPTLWRQPPHRQSGISLLPHM